jgi:16S rRNA processing protein RimM
VVSQLDTVTVGMIERAFGVKGEVKVRSLTDVPGRLEALTAVSVVGKNGNRMETTVTHVRRAGPSFIVGLAGLSNPEDAGLWRGGLIQVPRGMVPALPEGQYYECDLVGLAVKTEQGKPLGVLEQIWETPGNHVFVVRQGTKEILIPAAKELVAAVDLEQGVMTVRMIEGLDE